MNRAERERGPVSGTHARLFLKHFENAVFGLSETSRNHLTAVTHNWDLESDVAAMQIVAIGVLMPAIERHIDSVDDPPIVRRIFSGRTGATP